MERKSGPESSPLVSQNTDPHFSKSCRLFLITILMLWPWLCVSLGLFGIHDYRVALLGYGIFCCALPVILFSRQPLRFFPLAFKVERLMGVVIGLNLLIVGLFYATQFGLQKASFLQQSQHLQLSLNVQCIPAALYFLFLNPVLEEMFWRGFIYEEWKQFVSPQAACVISSVFFGAWHWVILQAFCPPAWALFLTVSVMIGGFLFTKIYDKTGTLGVPILIHGLGADLPLLWIALQLLKH